MQIKRPLSWILVAVLLLLAFAAGRACGPERAGGPAATAAGAPTATIWTCSMHPQVRLPEPGQCPICFMDLIPANAGAGEDELGPRTLRMTATAMKLAEIQTAPVERMSVAHEVSMVGKIAFDETRLAHLTAWVGGRLDRLFVDYTGVRVRKGDHMVEIYSPTLYTAQQELLQSIQTSARLDSSSNALEILRTTSNATIAAAREKLRLYGLAEAQIQEIVDRGTPDEHVVLLAPAEGIVVHKNALEGMWVDQGGRIYTIADLSRVWVLLDAYESDLAWLRYGQDVEFSVEAFPGETFHGRVAFIDPVLDDRTRTVKVRLNVENPDLRLKPDMFVSAHADAVLTPGGQVVDEQLAGKWMCPMHPEVIADGPADCPECGMDLVPVTELGFAARPDQGPSLVIPATAPLVTGKRAVVYVRVPDREEPTFEGREIALGPRAGDWYVVRDGLAEGELVVVHGNFKIDSELQIRAKPSMMSPQGGEPPPAHDHGGAPQPAGEHAGHAAAPDVDAPPELRAQLGAAAEAYLRLQEALAADEDAPDAARDLVATLGKVDMGALAGAAHDAWMEIAPELGAAAEVLADAGDLETRRARLAPLTEYLVRALETFGYAREPGTDDEALGVFHCPMAPAGSGGGADWIQAGAETTNPYFGSAMLRCGDRTRILERER